ncbi:hypothetical protein CYMTET_49441, partial [Cymbomonas tetramitiformis]
MTHEVKSHVSLHMALRGRHTQAHPFQHRARVKDKVNSAPIIIYLLLRKLLKPSNWIVLAVSAAILGRIIFLERWESRPALEQRFQGSEEAVDKSESLEPGSLHDYSKHSVDVSGSQVATEAATTPAAAETGRRRHKAPDTWKQFLVAERTRRLAEEQRQEEARARQEKLEEEERARQEKSNLKSEISTYLFGEASAIMPPPPPPLRSRKSHRSGGKVRGAVVDAPREPVSSLRVMDDGSRWVQAGSSWVMMDPLVENLRPDDPAIQRIVQSKRGAVLREELDMRHRKDQEVNQALNQEKAMHVDLAKGVQALQMKDAILLLCRSEAAASEPAIRKKCLEMGYNGDDLSGIDFSHLVGDDSRGARLEEEGAGLIGKPRKKQRVRRVKFDSKFSRSNNTWAGAAQEAEMRRDADSDSDSRAPPPPLNATAQEAQQRERSKTELMQLLHALGLQGQTTSEKMSDDTFPPTGYEVTSFNTCYKCEGDISTTILRGLGMAIAVVFVLYALYRLMHRYGTMVATDLTTNVPEWETIMQSGPPFGNPIHGPCLPLLPCFYICTSSVLDGVHSNEAWQDWECPSPWRLQQLGGVEVKRLQRHSVTNKGQNAANAQEGDGAASPRLPHAAEEDKGIAGSMKEIQNAILLLLLYFQVFSLTNDIYGSYHFGALAALGSAPVTRRVALALRPRPIPSH